MTKNAAAKTPPTVFPDGNVSTSERPTALITIGSSTYTARAPKYQVWWDVVRMLEDNRLATEATDTLASGTDGLSPAELRELSERLNLAGEFGEFQHALIYGQPLGQGRFRGGFLRRSLRPDDWNKIITEVDNDDSDLDLPDLYTASMTLQKEFEAWFLERSRTMGLPDPAIATAKPKPPQRR